MKMIIFIIYYCIIDLLSWILSESNYSHIYINDFSNGEWKGILYTITFVIFIGIIGIRINSTNRNYRNKMIVIEDKKNKKLNISIIVVVILLCVGSFIYNKSVIIFMLSFMVALVATLLALRETLEVGLVEEGILYKGNLIKWEDVIGYECQGERLKIITSMKSFVFESEVTIIIQVKDDDIWKNILVETIPSYNIEFSSSYQDHVGDIDYRDVK